jgi:adenine deaminase
MPESLRQFITVARGKEPADLVLKNARLVNVLSGEIHDTDLAVFDGRIVGFGDYQAKVAIDLKGGYLAPGFIDGHVHIESSKLLPQEYATAVVPRGTTSVVIDPHEIANVMGIPGIQLMLDASQEGPLSVYLTLSSCVPATHLETSGCHLSSLDLASLLENPRVVGIAELMNYPGLLAGDEEVLKKVQLGRGKRVDGHAPALTGKDLCAYVGAGIRSDHECLTKEEAQEKLRLGMHVMIREGSVAKNLLGLLPVIKPENSSRLFFATDDRSPEDLMSEGHVDYLLRKAISCGLEPITAIQMATINAASYFHLEELGAIAPGYRADMVVLDSLKDLRVLKVFKRGEIVAEDGELLTRGTSGGTFRAPCIMKVDWSTLCRLSIRAEGDWIKVMEIIPGQIVNRLTVEKAKLEGGLVVADHERDILKFAVIERHRGTGNVGVGFVRGFGLKGGALGSSVAHDSHNIVVLGTDDEETRSAAREVGRLGGGQVVVRNGRVLASLPLPVAGLMSDHSLEEVAGQAQQLKKAARGLGCLLDDPFMALSFLALPVVPELRVTDKGLVDVGRFGLVSLFGKT